MNQFVFVESNTTGTGRLAVERLLAQGEQVTFITRQPEKYPFLVGNKAPGLRVLNVETNDASAVEACVDGLVKEGRVAALLTFSTFYVPTVASIAARHGLRYLQPRAAQACHNKHEARAMLRAAGLPGPEFHVIASEAEAEQLARTVRFPCVVKPPAESGSTGVRRVDTPEELLAHFRSLHSRAANERGQSLRGEVLVESFLEGPEFSVETMTLADGTTHVLGVTQKYLSAPPYFVEMGHDFPADLPPERRRALEEAVLAGLAAVGFDFGPAHTEIRFTSSGPVIIEINPRLAGGMIPELVRLSTGVDLLSVMLEQMLGRPVDLTHTRQDVACIRFITSERPGVLARVEGQGDASRLGTVRQVAVDKAAGSRLRPPESATDRLGYVISSGPERERVLGDAARALSLLRIEQAAPA
ncbi:ATP-grasp domain-containing protein [Stigmatella sp. ncwal1]|uniref:ATP-grasp domain-containing protein n=1 Tax=Stigmatella ashevillensis TaxID=2995309 RepID=A0ABT5D3D7_9BACT|nr:ATP-grasp domain-containing protein [Stigmatella ashevillena]MDC0708188.1 ATP-grasp domain-containing protein [Stigmatella ashevillena]